MIRGHEARHPGAIAQQASRTLFLIAILIGAAATEPSTAAFAASPPSPVATPATTFATDGTGYCLITSGGGAKCWGENADGALGDGSKAASSNTAVSVKNLSNATSITGDLNNNGYCALLRAGTVKCWGYNGAGQLGDNLAVMSSDVPVPVSGLSGVTSLVSDGFSFCALLSSGGAKCWGYDFYGQLGDGGLETKSAVPVTVKGLTGARALVTDFNNGYCALVRNGGAACWGYNVSGALGNDSSPATTPSSNVPVTVSGLADASSIATDRYGYCALLGTGTAKCWGYNADGELGAGTGATNSPIPLTVLDLTHATSITGNGNGFGVYCALVASGATKCWGSNGPGTLGDGSSAPSSDTPVDVAGITNAITLASGGASFCALLHSGTAKCWGFNLDGELGNNGTETGSPSPVSVANLAGATALVTDGAGYCARVPGGAKCWGYNLDGQLGNGSHELSSPSPSSVKGLSS